MSWTNVYLYASVTENYKINITIAMCPCIKMNVMVMVMIIMIIRIRLYTRHIRFSDYIAIVFVFTVCCVLGTSLLLWIYAPIYSYYCPYKHYLLPVCFKCLYILPLYILCIYSFTYWKSGTSDLLVLMLFVLQCTDYKYNFLTLTLSYVKASWDYKLNTVSCCHSLRSIPQVTAQLVSYKYYFWYI